MQITKNFMLDELLFSKTASKRGIKNIPTPIHKDNLIESCLQLWQPARDILGKPMIISSGYRSASLNRVVGGSASSAHLYGFAIDFICPEFGNTRQVAEFLVKEFKVRNIGFDQLILEFPDSPSSWIHLGYKSSTGFQRNQVLTAKKIKGKTVYLSGLV